MPRNSLLSCVAGGGGIREMIVLRQKEFNSKAQKARRKKFDLAMEKKAHDGYIFDSFKKPTEAELVREGRRVTKANRTDLGFEIIDSPGKHRDVMDIHQTINQNKPNDIRNATSSFGTNPEAKKRVSRRLKNSEKWEDIWHQPKYEAGKKMEKDAKVGKWMKKNGKKSIAAAAIVGLGLGAKKLYDKSKKKDDSSKK